MLRVCPGQEESFFIGNEWTSLNISNSYSVLEVLGTKIWGHVGLDQKMMSKLHNSTISCFCKWLSPCYHWPGPVWSSHFYSMYLFWLLLYLPIRNCDWTSLPTVWMSDSGLMHFSPTCCINMDWSSLKYCTTQIKIHFSPVMHVSSFVMLNLQQHFRPLY